MNAEKQPPRLSQAAPLFRRILVPTDFTPCSLHALRHAGWLARKGGAEVHLLHVVEGAEDERSVGYSALDSAYDQLRAAAAREIRHEAAEVRKESSALIKTHVERGLKAAPVILDCAARLGADLIALGTHGRTGAERFLIGSVAERVARHAPCSVLTVGPSGDLLPGAIKCVLAPVDFSPSSLEALRQAKELAARFSARLYLLHVLEPVLQPVLYGDHPDIFAFSAPQVERRAREALEAQYAQIGGAPVSALYRAVRGHPASAITTFAKENAVHLIVQGAQGLTQAEEERLMGGVAERVVRTAPCPVLTVRPVLQPATAPAAAEASARQPTSEE